LDNSRAVAYQQKADFTAGTFIVQPNLNGHFLIFVLSGFTNANDFSHTVFLPFSVLSREKLTYRSVAHIFLKNKYNQRDKSKQDKNRLK
jgi:hypothetical protein